MNYLSGLNASQLQAASWNEGPLLVLAGPGSGKTKTLISRVARLIDESEGEAFRILCLTFTRKAAAEMRERLFDLVPEAKERVNLSTFHSFATDILRQHGSHFGLTPDFTILDKDEQVALIKRIIASDGEAYSAFLSAEKALDAVEYLFKELVPDEQVPRLVKNEKVGTQLAKLFKSYKEELCRANVLDYGAIIYFCEQMLGERKRLARQLCNVYKFICVDEFQDTNRSQYALLRVLSPSEDSNLFIVGDDDQIIYQWNGASPKRIDTLREHYELTQIQLPENYRCPAEVVELANILISHNTTRVGNKKPLRAIHKPKESSPVCVEGFATEHDEASGVAAKIKDKILSGVKPEEVVVLARNSKLLHGVASALSTCGIEAFVPVRKTNFESAPLRLIVETLKLSIVRSEQETLARLAKAFSDCFSIEIASNELAVSAAETSGDYFQAFANFVSNESGLREFSELVTYLQKGNGWRFIRGAFELFDTLSEKITNEQINNDSEAFSEYAEERKVWNNIINEIGGSNEVENMSLGQLLQEIALANKSSEPPSSAVRCFTIHASKGMEFSHVFLVGMAEDQLPSFQAKKKGDGSHEMQEERRNCFVAITRTKETLTMTFAGKYNGWSKKPSRFLYEMGIDTSLIPK